MTPQESYAFGHWAFGETWLDYVSLEADCIDLKHAWNWNHSDKFEFKYEDIFNIDKLKPYWEDYKNT